MVPKLVQRLVPTLELRLVQKWVQKLGYLLVHLLAQKSARRWDPRLVRM